MRNPLPLAAAALLLAASAYPQATVVNSFSTGGTFAAGVAYDASTDHVWVADQTLDTIFEFDRAGTQLNAYPAVSTLVVGITVDPGSNSLWVVDEDENVYEYDKTTGVATGFSFPVNSVIADVSSVAIDTDTGNLWFSQDSGTRQAAEFDSAGVFIRTVLLGATPSTDPDGLAFNTVTDTLLVGDDLANAVFEVDVNGTLLNTWSVVDPIYGAVSPEGLAIDHAGGKLFIASGTGNRVFEVDGIVAATPTGPTLAVNGPCPGPATADASGMTAGGPVVFFYALAAGSFTVGGGACAGLTVPVSAPTQLGPVVFADGAGNISLAGTQQPNHCGLVRVGAVDVATCTATNIVTL